MNTVIVINLDYETFPVVECQRAWALIEKGMVEAGFVRRNRLFIATVDSETAFARARDVMHRIEKDCHDEDVLLCVREFYGIPFSQIIDLARPSLHEVSVDLMATGAFQKLFPGYL